MGPSPLFEFFKRGEVSREVRLLAARGTLAPRAQEQLGILVLLLEDPDPEIRQTAEQTLGRIPAAAISKFLARPDAPPSLREFFAGRGLFSADAQSEAVPVAPANASAVSSQPQDEEAATSPPQDGEAAEAPLIDESEETVADSQENETPESATQRIAKMGFSDRLKAAVKGSREMRAILVRDSNKMIAAAVLSSPKLTQQEVESIARMANVSEDVLRTIGSNRAWTKNYSVVVGLTKNPKTPLALSMHLMQRLSDRDISQLCVDRNVPEPLRVAARKRASDSSKR